ncbi:CBM43-containing protein [Zostera marina]|uniref:CBM43-containing protein n=1 Tax=Zostera marina TaxID=29655 RepID=A0A0K9P552_ZOSMR|nr:CBM43-containing protein [Zostera marina]
MTTFIPLLWVSILLFFTTVASSSFLSFGKFIKTRKTTIPPSWCAAKEGVADASLQIALDYACGIGGVDCSAIQETGACYNPNTLQDHASYAFNVYYQNKPSLASCDFGGTAVIVYTNPIPNCANSVTPAPKTNTAPVGVLPPPTLVPNTAPVAVPVTPPPPSIPYTDPVMNPTLPPPTLPVTTPALVLPPTIPYTNPVMNPTLPPPTLPVTTPAMVLPPTIPYTTPVIKPLPPPTSSGSGQSWCVAKNDALDAALQLGIDYACGIKAIDCTAIEQGGSCYLPNTLRDHASYAFNGYYQKNPNPVSCDFGGTATIVNINPSSGTCVYPSSSSSSSVSNPAGDGGDGSTTVIGSTGSIDSNFPVTSDNHTSFARTSSLSFPTSIVMVAISAFFST